MDDFWKSKSMSDRYKPLSALGAGGMGFVYLARDLTLDKEVAIKVLGQSLTAEQSIRFQQEGKLSGRLRHDNIVSIMDFGVTERNRPYLVMEYLRGSSLNAHVTIHGAIEVAPAIQIFQQICYGMIHSHQQGILHRDLKPANVILVDNDDDSITAKIVDFGIARSKELDLRLTPTGDAVGSPFFISPEQADGKAVDERSDVYSMGCLMFKTLTGSVPFEGRSSIETVLMHKTEEPDLLSQRTGKPFPAALESAVSKCLKKLPQERYNDFQSLLNDLQSISAEIDDYKKPDSSETAPVLPAEKKRFPRKVLLALPLIGALVALAFRFYTKPEAPVATLPALHDSAAISAASLMKEFTTDEVDGKLLVKANGAIDDELIDIAKHKVIHHLELKNSACTGTGLAALRESTIYYLGMNRCPVDQEGINEIAKVKGLYCLFLEDCNGLNDESLAGLAKNPTLQFLIFDGSKFTENSFRFLRDYPNLISAQPGHMKITEKGMDWLLSIKKIKSLSFRDCELTPGAWDRLQKSRRRLVDVSISSGTFREETIRSLEKVPADKIGLSSAMVSNRGYELIQANPRFFWSKLTCNNHPIPDRKRGD